MLRWRDESGFAILTLLAVISVASAVIVGGSKTAASVYDKHLTNESSAQMRHLAKVVRDKGTALGGEEGQALVERARRMTTVASTMDDQAMDQVVSDVASNAVDALTIPIQGGGIFVKGALAAWDVYGAYELGSTALDAWTPTDPAAIARMSDLQQAVPEKLRGTPAGEAVAEAKVRSMRNAIEEADADEILTDEEVEALLADAVITMGTDDIPAPEVEDPFHNAAWQEVAEFVGVPVLTATVPPSETTTTTTTTTTVPGRPAEPLRLTWGCQHLDDGHDIATISIKNTSGSTIEGIHLTNLVLPDENWTPPPPWTLEPGETIRAVAKFRVSYYGLVDWDVATGYYAEDGEVADSNRLNGLRCALPGSEGDPDRVAACLASEGVTILSGPSAGEWNEEEFYVWGRTWPAQTIYFWEVTAQILAEGYSNEPFTMLVNDCGRCPNNRVGIESGGSQYTFCEPGGE